MFICVRDSYTDEETGAGGLLLFANYYFDEIAEGGGGGGASEGEVGFWGALNLEGGGGGGFFCGFALGIPPPPFLKVLCVPLPPHNSTSRLDCCVRACVVVGVSIC